jgi:hypothetical protein
MDTQVVVSACVMSFCAQNNAPRSLMMMDPTLVRPPPPMPAIARAAINVSMDGAIPQRTVPIPAKCERYQLKGASLGPYEVRRRHTEEEERSHHGSATADDVAQAACDGHK